MNEIEEQKKARRERTERISSSIKECKGKLELRASTDCIRLLADGRSFYNSSTVPGTLTGRQKLEIVEDIFEAVKRNGYVLPIKAKVLLEVGYISQRVEIKRPGETKRPLDFDRVYGGRGIVEE